MAYLLTLEAFFCVALKDEIKKIKKIFQKCFVNSTFLLHLQSQNGKALCENIKKARRNSSVGRATDL